MADAKISQLPAATEPLNDADLVEVVQGGVNKKAPKSAFGSPASAASESTAGIIEIATQAEVTTGTDDVRAITPLKLATAVPAASESAAGKAEIATQAETNTGTDDARIVTALKLKNRDGAVATLTDGATVDITSDKNTLATSSATRTFTISHTGDDISLVVTLSATSSVFTFPAAALCISEGFPSGDNTCTLGGVSGDKYFIGIRKIGSAYYVACKNFGQ